jgi:short-subunit dehydrogenase
MSAPFEQRVVLITGGSSGIGKALVEQFLSLGAHVATCGRHLAKLQETFANIKSDQLLLVQADVSVESEAAQFVESSIQKFGRIDFLINNAGISMRALFEDLDLSVLKQLMAINFWGTVYTTKFALPKIIESEGIIVGVSSIAGYRGLPARTGYSASKFAMQGFLEALRTEMIPKKVHVMWACPGFTKSNIRNTALGKDGHSQKETPLKEDKLMSSEEVADRIIRGMATKQRTIVMTSMGFWTVFLNKLFPKFMDKLVLKHFAKEPDSPIKL